MNSPLLKDFAERRIAAGESMLVVDLGACAGMDSTFMGTLAGIAARLSASDGATLQIADPGERNRRSLEDLGLDFLMEIDPPAAIWRGRMDRIRSGLQIPNPPTAGGFANGQLQRAKHVLEAHQTLSDVNEQNSRAFSNVVRLLEEEVSEKENPSQPGTP
jgi:anti-anti-sigma regulatory factor